MLSPEIIKQRKLEIADGKLCSVIKFLLQSNLNKDRNNSVLSFSSRFKRIKKREIDGTVEYDVVQRELTKIEIGVISILDEILENIESLHSQNQNNG